MITDDPSQQMPLPFNRQSWQFRRFWQLFYVFFHVVHDGVEIVFLEEDVLQANAAFFRQALCSGLRRGQLHSHFLVEEGDEFIRFHAGDKGASGVLLKHDLAGWRLAIKFHQVESASGHANFLRWAPGTSWRVAGDSMVTPKFNAGIDAV